MRIRHALYRFQIILFLSALIYVLTACAPSPLVKPLTKNTTRIEAHVGGPFIGYAGTTIPMPLSSVSVAHGLRTHTSMFASAHTTAFAFGIIQLNSGVLHQLQNTKGFQPGISIAPALHGMIDIWAWRPRLYPSVDINLFWQAYNSRLLYYAGVSNWFELKQKRAHDELQPTHWIPALHSGLRWQQKHWDYGLEMKWLAPLTNNQNIVVDYKIPGNYGALGVYLSTGYRF